jgi:hypothetical protein
MGVTVEIGELVLHGFPPGDRHAIGDAVRAELQRLVEAHGVPDAGRSAARVDAGEVHAGPTPQATGVAVARAVHAGLGAAP